MDTPTAVNLFLKSRHGKGLSPETIKWYRGVLSEFARQFPQLPERSEKIDDFLITCQAGDERRHGYYRTLRAFYRFLYRRFKVENIVALVDPPKRSNKRPRPLTLDELDQVLTFPHTARIQAAIMFLSDSGARVGEAAHLKPQDLAQTEWGPLARVNDREHGKTGTRLVPIGEATYRTLLAQLPFGLSPNRLSRLISHAFKDAHVKGSAHSLRHTFGTYWDGDELMLQYILGHAHLSTTQMYRQLRTRKMCEQHREYSPLKLVMAHRQMPLPMDSGLLYDKDRD